MLFYVQWCISHRSPIKSYFQVKKQTHQIQGFQALCPFRGEQKIGQITMNELGTKTFDMNFHHNPVSNWFNQTLYWGSFCKRKFPLLSYKEDLHPCPLLGPLGECLSYPNIMYNWFQLFIHNCEKWDNSVFL